MSDKIPLGTLLVDRIIQEQTKPKPPKEINGGNP